MRMDGVADDCIHVCAFLGYGPFDGLKADSINQTSDWEKFRWAPQAGPTMNGKARFILQARLVS